MYRAVAWFLQKHGIDPKDGQSVHEALGQMDLEIDAARVLVNGRDVSRVIRSPELSQLASIIAALPMVREFLVVRQRAIAEQGNFVCEGRDQGSVVFPDAECKFFLTAAPEIRGRRRWLELCQKQPDLKLDDVIAEQKIRDLRDETRRFGRLVKPPDAVEISVDDVTLEELVDQMERQVRIAIRQQAAGPGQR